VSRVGAYQAAAARCGTAIERADVAISPRIGGAITKHPLAPEVAKTLVRDLRQLGAEAKLYHPDRSEGEGDRLFVYLAGCSFVKGDLL
jgi:DNA-binding transcriptional regulator YdaS (Cro superfamily)